MSSIVEISGASNQPVAECKASPLQPVVSGTALPSAPTIRLYPTYPPSQPNICPDQILFYRGGPSGVINQVPKGKAGILWKLSLRRLHDNETLRAQWFDMGDGLATQVYYGYNCSVVELKAELYQNVTAHVGQVCRELQSTIFKEYHHEVTGNTTISHKTGEMAGLYLETCVSYSRSS